MSRKSVTVISRLTPARRMMSAASGPFSLVLSGTSTAPTVCRASSATTHSAMLGAQIERRSPASTPLATKARAASSTRSASSANVHRSSPSTMASTVANRSAARVTTSGIVAGISSLMAAQVRWPPGPEVTRTPSARS